MNTTPEPGSERWAHAVDAYLDQQFRDYQPRMRELLDALDEEQPIAEIEHDDIAEVTDHAIDGHRRSAQSWAADT